MTRPLEDPPRLQQEPETPAELSRQIQVAKRGLPSDAQLGALSSRLAVLLNTPPGGRLDEPEVQASGKRRRFLEAAASLGVLTKAVSAAALGAALSAGVYWVAQPSRVAAPIPTVASAVKGPPRLPELVTHGPDMRATIPESSAPEKPALAPPRKLAPAPRAPSSTAQAIAPLVDEETASVQAAQSALASDPRKALVLTGEHAKEFPSGKLAQEREIIAITALVRLGESSAARQRAARFRSSFPQSAYLPRLNRLLDEPAR